MATIELARIRVERGGDRLLDGVDLWVGAGERLVLLGPSAAGKSTLLRVIAGLQAPAAGTVRIDGSDVTHLPPSERDVAMVDQRGSLQPHLDVRRNIGFPLRIRGMRRDEIDTRVAAETGAFSLRSLLRRRPDKLSSGQRRDVALARSLVRRAGVLLLDEAFVHTDERRTAEQVRQVIASQEGYGSTLVAATNDQRVAMTLAHRVAVLQAGRIVQVADPHEIHRRPRSTFVARFVGEPEMNLVPARVEDSARGLMLVADGLRLRALVPALRPHVGRQVTIGIRPTDLHRAPHDAVFVLEERVHGHTLLGARVRVEVGDPRRPFVAELDHPAPRPGELLALGIRPGDVQVFDAGGTALAHGI